MAQADLVLVHAPSHFDFREHTCLYGPIADLIPSNPVFEMFPIGFTTLAGHLERNGYRTRIVNLAVRMLRSPRFDPARALSRLRPTLFGIDLHWLPHAHGSLAVAALLKELHPHIPVVFGGFSSTFFHEELLGYPQVDYVLRGDSCEASLLELMQQLDGPAGAPALDGVPGLTWRRSDGTVQVNEMAPPVEDLNDLVLDYGAVQKAAARHLDIAGSLPFHDYLRYPITAALSVKGCVHGCRTCGGSAAAYCRLHGRKRPAFRGPELLAADIRSIGRFTRGPIFVLGDLMQAGEAYMERFCAAVSGFAGPVTMEFFDAAQTQVVESLAAALPGLTLQVSMESHDLAVRKAFGRAAYTNEQMEGLMETAFAAGVSRLDLFFMVGLPKQDMASVLATAEYAGELMDRFAKHEVDGVSPLVPFISPLAPFMDPGSPVFMEPERHGYTLLCRTLEEHRQALEAPSWKLMLNYRTQWLSRQQIVEATYQAQARLVELKAEHGLATGEEAAHTRELVARDLELMGKIDAAMELPEESERRARMTELAPSIDELNRAGVGIKRRLKVPHGRGPLGFPFRITYLMGMALRGLFERRVKRGVPRKR